MLSHKLQKVALSQADCKKITGWFVAKTGNIKETVKALHRLLDNFQ